MKERGTAIRAAIGEHGELLRLLILTVATLVIMSALTDGRLLTPGSLESMAFQLPELALLSFAMMLAMLTGGIDLSIVSVANLSGIAAAMVMTRLSPSETAAAHAIGPVVLGTGVALAVGLVCGSISGLLIAVVGVSPILATLGTMQLFSGLALVLTRGQAIIGLPELLERLGNGTALGLPIPAWLFLVVAAGVGLLSTRTVFGIESRLVGANVTAARFSGIAVRSVLVRTYLATAAIASLTGVLMIARANSAKADYGASYLLQSILVVVLGGVSPAGGFGRVLGVGIAVVALQLLSSGFGMLHLSSFAKELAWGGFLLLVMVANSLFDNSHRE